jgi:two-component system, NarL family, nitrate/nitrite response regulator NarL
MTKGGSRWVLIADTQPIFRLGLVALLESIYPDWTIVEADTIGAHRGVLQGGSVDLLIVDSRLLGQEFSQGLQIDGGIGAWTDIIAVTEPGDTIGPFGCLAMGARATVSRSDPTSRTLATIEILVMHNLPNGRAANTAMSLGLVPGETPETDGLVNLTARQFDVLRLLAKGQSNKVIARDLGLSVSTVKSHLNTVFRALGARNRVEAVIRARPFHDRMHPPGN